MTAPLLSAAPVVRLTKTFSTPYRNVVATARTCYSPRGIVDDTEVGGPERFSPLAKSIYEAGHHTTFQHAHVQFAIENASRHFIWSFLHSHPFYNSEQVSQRYVTVKPDSVLVPALDEPALSVYRETVEKQFDAYRRLCELFHAPVEAEFFRRFNRSERMAKSHQRTIGKKAQEVARYVLPVATHAYMYHTVSAITLLRYWRVADQLETPVETRMIVGEMIRQLLEFDPEYAITLQEPLDPSVFPESRFHRAPGETDGGAARDFRREFDAQLDGKWSKLVAWTGGAEELVASAVRETLGLSSGALSDDEAIRLAMNPAANPVLGESLNLSTVTKLPRALYHAHYTFRRKISHTADSQNQRHRMTPGSRPVLMSHIDDEPDYITPEIVLHDDRARSIYDDAMATAWEAMTKLRRLGVRDEWVGYLLPNAVSVRYTESADLLNLRHKHQMRLCYNAQEEIWRASRDEALQIRDVQPRLGQYLLPPCTLRGMAKARPLCPEGPRYCGVMVWKKDVQDYERVI